MFRNCPTAPQDLIIWMRSNDEYTHTSNYRSKERLLRAEVRIACGFYSLGGVPILLSGGFVLGGGEVAVVSDHGVEDVGLAAG